MDGGEGGVLHCRVVFCLVLQVVFSCLLVVTYVTTSKYAI